VPPVWLHSPAGPWQWPQAPGSMVGSGAKQNHEMVRADARRMQCRIERRNQGLLHTYCVCVHLPGAGALRCRRLVPIIENLYRHGMQGASARRSPSASCCAPVQTQSAAAQSLLQRPCRLLRVLPPSRCKLPLLPGGRCAGCTPAAAMQTTGPQCLACGMLNGCIVGRWQGEVDARCNSAW
jgi:hypothetical protein